MLVLCMCVCVVLFNFGISIFWGGFSFQQSFEWVCVPVLSSHQHCWGFLHLGEKANVRDSGSFYSQHLKSLKSPSLPYCDAHFEL